MNCQPTHSLQSRAALLQPEMHMYDVKMDLHQYLTHRRRMRRGVQRRRYWSRSWMRPERWRQFGMYYQLYGKCVRKYILLNPASACWCPFCSVCPLCIRYSFWLSVTCLFTDRHSFGANWLVELKPCVTYLLPVRSYRSMSGACTSVHSVFLPDWPFCHRIFFFIRFYPFHVRRFNPVKFDSGFIFSVHVFFW